MKYAQLAAILLTCSVIALSGCSSVQVGYRFNKMGVDTERTQGIAHLNSTIYGYYFFGLPVLTGSVARSNTTAYFTDTVTIDNCLLQMNRAARAMGANKVINIQSHTESSWLWATLFFSYREVQMSGTAIK